MEARADLSVRALGPLEVRQGDRVIAIDGAKPRAVLTLLALYAGRVVTAATLTDLLWDDPPRTAHKALQTHVSTLRRAIGADAVLTRGTGWVLDIDLVDAVAFRSWSERGVSATRDGNHADALVAFEHASRYWRGQPELPTTADAAAELTRWSEAYLSLVEAHFDASLACGHAVQIIPDLEAAVVAAPARERLWELLCLALYRASRQADALAAYHRARTWLADEIGVEPGPALQGLQRAMLRQDPALLADAVTPAGRQGSGFAPVSAVNAFLRDPADGRPQYSALHAAAAEMAHSLSSAADVLSMPSWASASGLVPQ